mmetsp:Transcript_23783/g.43128  ORF Transcript_23783/g.43128 Transcript_23783/m.43128 type:complete len:113 (-) Transcript_23783:108-446(-)
MLTNFVEGLLSRVSDEKRHSFPTLLRSRREDAQPGAPSPRKHSSRVSFCDSKPSPVETRSADLTASVSLEQCQHAQHMIPQAECMELERVRERARTLARFNAAYERYGRLGR